MNHVTHVIFDVDGLLLDTELIYTEFTSDFLKPYGFTFDYEIKSMMMGRKPRESAELLLKHFDLPISVDEYLKIQNQYLSPERWNQVSSMPGAERLMYHLASCNIPMAAATGCCSHELIEKTRNHNFWPCISHSVCAGDDPEFNKIELSTFYAPVSHASLIFTVKKPSGACLVKLAPTQVTSKLKAINEEIFHQSKFGIQRVKHGKPMPDVFLIAASRFSTPPNNLGQVLVFEDAPCGLEAAVKAGMQVVWVPDPRSPPGLYPEAICDSDYSRITRLNSLLEFNPEKFGLPPFP